MRTHALALLVLLLAPLPALAQQPSTPPPQTVTPAPTPQTAGPAPAATAAPAPAPAPRRAAVLHLASNQTHEGRLLLDFDVAAIDEVGDIVVHYRRHGASYYETVRARRTAVGDRWTAEVPRAALRPPSVEYYAVGVKGHVETPIFASAAAPHPVVVVEPDTDWHEHDELRLTSDHRSRVTALGEWIDYGSRTLCPNPTRGCTLGETPQLFVDQYFHGEVSYAYGMFGTVEWLRFSLGVLRGSAAQSDFGGALSQKEVGLYYGTSEITWYAVSWFRARTQLIFGVSQFGFEFGLKGALVFGRDGDMQLTLEGGGVTNIGGSGLVRLSWASVPHVPMAAVVEVSSLPGGRDAGVRMLLEAGYEVEPGTVIRVFGGYQARTQVVGGPTIGAELVLGL